jgi:hypothetical protein
MKIGFFYLEKFQYKKQLKNDIEQYVEITSKNLPYETADGSVLDKVSFDQNNLSFDLQVPEWRLNLNQSSTLEKFFSFNSMFGYCTNDNVFFKDVISSDFDIKVNIYDNNGGQLFSALINSDSCKEIKTKTVDELAQFYKSEILQVLPVAVLPDLKLIDVKHSNNLISHFYQVSDLDIGSIGKSQLKIIKDTIQNNQSQFSNYYCLAPIKIFLMNEYSIETFFLDENNNFVDSFKSFKKDCRP